MTELSRDRIDFEIAEEISDLVGQRVRGRQEALRVGLASLCLSITSALHKLADDEAALHLLTEMQGLIGDLYFAGYCPPHGKKRKRLRVGQYH